MSKINISLNNWLFNAGVVGFINILEHAENKVVYKGQEVEVDKNVLEGFEEKYFKYFIDIYKKTLSFTKILNIKGFIEKHEAEEYSNFDLEALEQLNNYIGTKAKSGTMKYLINSNSYKKAYEVINDGIDVLEIENDIKTIKVGKNENIKDYMDEIKNTIASINLVINYFEKEETIKHVGAKNVMYTLIKNAWNGVSFLNPQTKHKDSYEDYSEHYLKVLDINSNEENENYKYCCSNCSIKMKDMNNDLSFLNATGFDTNRKSSHVWNYYNDMAICPTCKLIYSCVPAGFTYIYSSGIFVNQNNDSENLVKVNRTIKSEVLDSEAKSIWKIYQTITEEMTKKVLETSKYELSDIQVVRYEDEKYRFNLLTKEVLKVLRKSKDSLIKVMNRGYQDTKGYYNIYDEAIRSIINSENLFLQIHNLLIIKLSKANKINYNNQHILELLKINTNYLEGVTGMENNNILENSKNAGYYFRKSYEEKNAENKINGIAYRLLNSLKTNNKHMFMDTLINCYLYIKQSVPKVFVEGMKDDYEFKSIGYAFVAGITNEGYKKDSQKEEN